MMNTSKGFTLIELLAVIIILAIIILIVPAKISEVIERAKISSAESNSFGYVDTIEKQIVISMAKGREQLKDGVYDVPVAGISLNGNLPELGWLKIEKGQVTSYSFLIDEYVVTKGEITVKGDTVATKPEDGNTVINKIYKEGDIVYFDPVTRYACNEHTKNNTCYKWRVIETKDNISNSFITLQMDHNLINNIEWSSSDNMAGPIIALTALNKATKTWVRVDNLTYEYDTTAAKYNYGKMTCNDGVCKLNGVRVAGTAKARMITGEEIVSITNTKVINESYTSKKWNITSSYNDYFYFSNTYRTIGTKEEGTGNTELKWLLENTSEYKTSGATLNGEANNGYWTLSPVSDYHVFAWFVHRNGHLYYYLNVRDDTANGVRPVIIVAKSRI